MSELQYQNDMLKAMNQKLKGNEEMYRLVCETSYDDFYYYYESLDSVIEKEEKRLSELKDINFKEL